jgi:Zn-dependent protease
LSGDFSDILRTICIYALPVIFAITVHEAAHGWAAKQFGDRTAEMLGRLTFNPIKHIDPIGTVVVPIITTMAGFTFGWAKPVPVSTNQLRNPKRDMVWVAAAGPASNIIMALLWGVLASALNGANNEVAQFWFRVGLAGLTVNAALAVLNMLPLLPLDGGRVLAGLLPNKLSYAYSRLEPYGFFILIALVITKLLNEILRGPLAFVIDTIASIVGLK